MQNKLTEILEAITARGVRCKINDKYPVLISVNPVFGLPRIILHYVNGVDRSSQKLSEYLDTLETRGVRSIEVNGAEDAVNELTRAGYIHAG